MSDVQKLEVSEGEDGMRLNRWVKAHFPAIRFGDLQKLLRTGQIRVDGGRAKANARLESGQMIRMPPLHKSDAAAKKRGRVTTLSDADAEFAQSLVIYQDKSIIAFNKPSGLAVQGGSKTHQHIDRLLEAFVDKDGERPRLVHRIDKDTSGVLIAARSRKAAAKLTKAFRTSDARKVYWGLVSGIPRPDEGTIKLPLAKRLLGGVEKTVALTPGNRDGQRAVTNFSTISIVGRKFAWLMMLPETGRKHQLRVHAAAMGHAIVGDSKYRDFDAEPVEGLVDGLHLHARGIKIPHPDGGIFEIQAPLTGHMAATWKFLGFSEHDGDEQLAELEQDF